MLMLSPWQPPVGPEKVLLVSSSQTVVDVRPEAKDATICNLEIKVRSVMDKLSGACM